MNKSAVEASLGRLEFFARRMPVIIQTEAAECGLACLAMIAGHHGFLTDLSALRARFSLSLKGSNLAQLVRYANDLNLFSRPLRLEVDELSSLKLPCILHWNLNHFVVLQKVEQKGIVIHDPSVGVRKVAFAEVGKHFTGVALELTPTMMAIATLAMMLLYSPKLTLVVVLAVLLYAMLRSLSYRPLRAASQESLILSAKEQSCFLESIRAVQAIKLFGRELDRQSRWLNLKVDSVNRSVRTQKFMLWFGIANTGLFGIQGLLLFWLGAHMVMDGAFTVGMLFAFTSYSGQFTSRLASLIDKFFSFRMLSLHDERLADIVLETAEEDTQHEADATQLQSRIELINVSFRYGQGEPWVVRHLDLVIEPGESVALVGPSGCGKTTLVKLILGVLSPSEGEIRYDGMPIQALGHRAYRQAMAVVMQDDQLLSGSLSDNISFFDSHADQDRIQACARLAAIHDDIAAMPMGYHTLAGDMGTTLSGGQKQRVLLARALYKSPKVLVLDEATSHLDVERERMVNQSIRALDITRISVAHRPETIAMCGRVVRLNHGTIEQDFRQLDTHAA